MHLRHTLEAWYIRSRAWIRLSTMAFGILLVVIGGLRLFAPFVYGNPSEVASFLQLVIGFVPAVNFLAYIVLGLFVVLLSSWTSSPS